MLCQHDTVADQQITNQFPGNQVGTIIANANWHDYCKCNIGTIIASCKGGMSPI